MSKLLKPNGKKEDSIPIDCLLCRLLDEILREHAHDTEFHQVNNDEKISNRL